MPRLSVAQILPFVMALGFSGAAGALTLGELRVSSAIGEPLRARIPYSAGPGEILGTECVSLTRPSRESDPRSEYLARGELDIRPGSGEIRLSSPLRFHEPVLRVQLRISCGGMNLVRDFSALVDPPGSHPSVVSPAAATHKAPATAAPPPPPRVLVAPEAADRTSVPAPAPIAAAAPGLVLECEQAARDAQNQLDRCLTLRDKVELLESDVKAIRSTVPAKPAQPIPFESKAERSIPLLSLQDWMMILAALLVAFIGILTLRQKRQLQAAAASAAAPRTLPPWLERERRSGRSYEDAKPDETKSPKAEASADVDTLLLEARRLMVHDKALSAIKLLDDFIHAHPDEPRPWMMRFVLLGARQMSREFAIAARQFKQRNPEPELWENVCALGREVDPENPLYGPPTAPRDAEQPKPPGEPDGDQASRAPSPEEDREPFRHTLDFSWLTSHPEKREPPEEKP